MLSRHGRFKFIFNLAKDTFLVTKTYKNKMLKSKFLKETYYKMIILNTT